MALALEGCEVVAVHEGLVRLIEFLNEMRRLSIEVKMVDWIAPVTRETIELDLGEAKMRSLCRYIETPFDLPSVRGLFSADLLQRWYYDTAAVLGFVLEHELAHHELGHRSELVHGREPRPRHTVLEESSTYSKEQEYEADVRAARAASENRDFYLSRVATFFDDLGLIEAYCGKLAESHPFASNRATNLLEVMRDELSNDLRSGFELVAGGSARFFSEWGEAGRAEIQKAFVADNVTHLRNTVEDLARKICLRAGASS